MAGKAALVFGASGVSGWAMVNEMLHNYPGEDTWSHIHALTNRSMDAKTATWPDGNKLTVTSGIDLLSTNDGNDDRRGLETQIGSIAGIENVTHVFYMGESYGLHQLSESLWLTCGSFQSKYRYGAGDQGECRHV
jgi:hypothetical protein